MTAVCHQQATAACTLSGIGQTKERGKAIPDKLYNVLAHREESLKEAQDGAEGAKGAFLGS